MPSLDQLQAGAEVVEYELEMLIGCWWWFSTPRDKQPTGFERNVHLESFLVHCRNLWDFLESRTVRDQDDILAIHYIEGWQPTNPLGKFVRIAINKQLAHVSYDRAAYHPGDKPWEIGSMTRSVVEAFQEFLHALPPQYREWFRPLEDDPSEYDETEIWPSS